jgi:hypothetical protein
MICPDAGPLGATVHHPGPIVPYGWRGVVLPPWMVDQARDIVLTGAEHPLERALLESLAHEAVPYRYTLEPQFAEYPLEDNT